MLRRQVARSSPRPASSPPSAPTAGTEPTSRSPAPNGRASRFIAEPVLIALVLSPPTAATDRDRKLCDYRTIPPSLQDILVVSSTVIAGGCDMIHADPNTTWRSPAA